MAVAHQLRCKACEPHTCVCGKPVDAHGLYGLFCRKSAPRQQRHSYMNGIIWRAIKRAQVPAVKEPVSLTLEDKKVQMAPLCFPGLKGNHWLGMSQSQTPMQSHSSLSQCHPRGGSSSSGTTQDCQVYQAGKHTPHCHRNSRHMG